MSGIPIVNVFHVANNIASPVSYTAAGITALATGVSTHFGAQFCPRLNALYTGEDVTAVDLSGPAGVEGQAIMNVAGGVVGAATAANGACCITWKILRHYRGGHPRTYLGPLGGAAFESPTSLATAFVGLVQTSATTFRNAINALSADGVPQTLVCVHRYVDKQQLATPIVEAITGNSVDGRIDSQRRRLGRDR